MGWGNDIEQGETLDLLSGLEKSLVVSEPTEDGGVRYRLLEPVRQYALESWRRARTLNRSGAGTPSISWLGRRSRAGIVGAGG